MSLCTLTNTVQSAGSDPGGGGPISSDITQSYLVSVTAELKGSPFPLNDGFFPIEQIYSGTVVNFPVFGTGYLIGYRNYATYTVQVPFVDQLFQGSAPLAAPFSVYYLVTERYVANNVPAPETPGYDDRYTVVRKVRPLAAGGAAQAVSAILV